MIFLVAALALFSPAQGHAKACLSDRYKEMRDLYEKPFVDGEGNLKPEYQKQNTEYRNTGQHDDKLAGQAEGRRGGGRNVKNSPLPDDAEAVWKRAFPEPGANGKTWWAWNEDCKCFYRYQGSIKGDKMWVHWNGMSKPGKGARVPPAEGTEFFGEGDVPKYARARRDAIDAYRDELGRQIERVTTQFAESGDKPVRLVTESGEVLEGKPAGISEDRGAVYAEVDVGPPRGKVKVHMKDVREIGPAGGAPPAPKVDVGFEKTDVAPAKPAAPPAKSSEAGTTVDKAGDRGQIGQSNKGTAPAFSHEPVHLEPSTTEISGEKVHRPAIDYRAPDVGQPAKKVAESMLGKPLGDEIGAGGFRRVYDHPGDPEKVVKVYDPTMGQKKSPQLVGEALQRELGYEELLRKFGFKVAKIERNPELLERGIIVQERVHGKPLGELLDRENPGHMLDPNLQAKYDEFMARAVKYEKALLDDQKAHYSWTMLGGTPSLPVGLDLGGGFSNVWVSDAGEFVLIDW
ncbi:MAG: hypothetical protein HY074_20145 [Deltaproteobacteria bacterium]|nr:hypothetical protein [Deltaproteobacteria bacterium]